MPQSRQNLCELRCRRWHLRSSKSVLIRPQPLRTTSYTLEMMAADCRMAARSDKVTSMEHASSLLSQACRAMVMGSCLLPRPLQLRVQLHTLTSRFILPGLSGHAAVAARNAHTKRLPISQRLHTQVATLCKGILLGSVPPRAPRMDLPQHKPAISACRPSVKRKAFSLAGTGADRSWIAITVQQCFITSPAQLGLHGDSKDSWRPRRTHVPFPEVSYPK